MSALIHLDNASLAANYLLNISLKVSPYSEENLSFSGYQRYKKVQMSLHSKMFWTVWRDAKPLLAVLYCLFRHPLMLAIRSW